MDSCVVPVSAKARRTIGNKVQQFFLQTFTMRSKITLHVKMNSYPTQQCSIPGSLSALSPIICSTKPTVLLYFIVHTFAAYPYYSCNDSNAVRCMIVAYQSILALVVDLR